jgi:hypothetical protein
MEDWNKEASMALTREYLLARRPHGDVKSGDEEQSFEDVGRGLVSLLIDEAISALPEGPADNISFTANVTVEEVKASRGEDRAPGHPGCIRICVGAGERKWCFHSYPM